MTWIWGTNRHICLKGHCFGITRLCRMMPNSDPKDTFVDPYLTLMTDSFSCTIFLQTLELKLLHFTLKYAANSRQPFCFWCHSLTLLWCWLATNLRDVHYNQSEAQDQSTRVRTSRSDQYSDPGQNPGFTCTFSSGLQEHISHIIAMKDKYGLLCSTWTIHIFLLYNLRVNRSAFKVCFLFRKGWWSGIGEGSKNMTCTDNGGACWCCSCCFVLFRG